MAFGPTFIQPPAQLPFRDPRSTVDNPLSEFRDNEVYWMNRDRRWERMEWQEAHQ